MGAEWFRNQTWDETIERGFNEKLRRARKKDQYLRIQALTLGRLDEAIGAYEAALAREIEFPNFRTPAYLDLPYLIATRNIRVRFAQAIQLSAAVNQAEAWILCNPKNSLSVKSPERTDLPIDYIVRLKSLIEFISRRYRAE